MYGRDFLDWTDKESASEAIDAFLASMPAHERKWVLAVLRERFEVRVEYEDSPLQRLARLNRSQTNSKSCSQPHWVPSFASGILG